MNTEPKFISQAQMYDSSEGSERASDDNSFEVVEIEEDAGSSKEPASFHTMQTTANTFEQANLNVSPPELLQE